MTSPLQEALAGRMLTGLLVEDARLHLRMTDRIVTLDLTTGEVTLNRRREKGSQAAPWVVLPGWLRITNAVRETNQVRLGVSGALFSSQIRVARKQDRWRILVKDGGLLAVQGGMSHD